MAKFCVIAPMVNAASQRTWTNDVDAAVARAQRLMANNEKTEKLFVVQVVKVIERPLPAVVARDFDDALDN